MSTETHPPSAQAILRDQLVDVLDEYDRAKDKHGDYTLDGPAASDVQRLAALVEEVGEVARTLTYDQDHAGSLYRELIQVANVALTWASYVGRPTWRLGDRIRSRETGEVGVVTGICFGGDLEIRWSPLEAPSRHSPTSPSLAPVLS